MFTEFLTNRASWIVHPLGNAIAPVCLDIAHYSLAVMYAGSAWCPSFYRCSRSSWPSCVLETCCFWSAVCPSTLRHHILFLVLWCSQALHDIHVFITCSRSSWPIGLMHRAPLGMRFAPATNAVGTSGACHAPQELELLWVSPCPRPPDMHSVHLQRSVKCWTLHMPLSNGV